MPGQPVKILAKPYSTYADLFELNLLNYKKKVIVALSSEDHSINTNYQCGSAGILF